MTDNEDNENIIKYDIGIFDPEGKNSNPLNNKPYSDTYKTLAKFWSKLPAYQFAKQVVETIQKNEVIVLESGTGSGKSVLICKYALHYLNYVGHVVMTLPKKLITQSTAQFSAKCLDVELGEQVGYAFRGDSVKSKDTVLLYCTDGTIVAQIKSDPTLRD